MVSPTDPRVRVREAIPADLSIIADICVSAMANDDFIAFLYPRRDQYPVNYRDHLLRDAKESFYSANLRCFVAEVDDELITSAPASPAESSRTRNRVVGWACWRTSSNGISTAEPILGDHDSSRTRPRTWFDETRRALERSLLAVESRYQSLFLADRAASSSAKAEFRTAVSRLDHFAHLPPSSLYLTFLVVDPAFQRRGVGAALLKWGLEVADRGGLPVGVKASRVGQRLYRKLGFQEIGETRLGGGAAGFTTMVRWPRER